MTASEQQPNCAHIAWWDHSVGCFDAQQQPGAGERGAVVRLVDEWLTARVVGEVTPMVFVQGATREHLESLIAKLLQRQDLALRTAAERVDACLYAWADGLRHMGEDGCLEYLHKALASTDRGGQKTEESKAP